MRAPTPRICDGRAPLIFTTALVVWGAILAPDPRGATRTALPTVLLQPVSDTAGTSASMLPPPAAKADRRGADVTFESYPLGDRDLATLRLGDRIELPHPDGGTIELTVARSESTPGRRHVMLLHDGLASTFTRARGAFFGTLATPTGVYALEGTQRTSRLTRHALLDQRMSPYAPDYRSTPSG